MNANTVAQSVRSAIRAYAVPSLIVAQESGSLSWDAHAAEEIIARDALRKALWQD